MSHHNIKNSLELIFFYKISFKKYIKSDPLSPRGVIECLL